MKRFKKHWFAVVMVLFLIALFAGGIAFKRGGWQVDFEPKCRLHFHAKNPYYKSYRIEWCHGFQPTMSDNGRIIAIDHFYKMPSFHHVDIEQVLKEYPVVLPERFKKQ
jgi:hypothetical protein